MTEVCGRAVREHIDAVAFGDLFLPDVRAYREKQLQPTGLEPLFPLWQIPTAALAREMIASGLRAKVVCVDTKQLPGSFAGREYDTALLDELPPGIDPMRRARRISHLRPMQAQCSHPQSILNPENCDQRRIRLRGLSGAQNFGSARVNECDFIG
jgi:hypothetical protein